MGPARSNLSERGATAPEYALIGALVAGVIVLSVTALGQMVLDLFETTTVVFQGLW
ncbi:MAG: Flp family type IVb pilin [Acidimicrobiia bacterium]|nr:Flp family type IVb pilin [Acidimicrobiia bacterium]